MESFDIIIIGSGISGLSTAIKSSKFSKIALITKAKLENSNTYMAQGGLAAVFSLDDNKSLHYFDTIRAGDGLCNEKAVQILVDNAPSEVKWLMKNKVRFNKKNDNLVLSREAVHSRPRIVHFQDITGREIEEALIKKVRKIKNIKIFENHFAIHLMIKEKKAIGVVCLDRKNNKIKIFHSKYTILSTGGAGQVYKYNTNPETSTGDGVAIAYRAGAKIQDMEFFQFHPTALFNSKPLFLLSETLRGEGALLKNKFGKTYMERYHRDGDLAPRDVVSKFSIIEMQKTKSNYVLLDISHKDSHFIKKRFPNIYNTCLKYNYDLTKQAVPVTPAAHYMIGGIKTDLKGKTSIYNLYAVGETSCNGLHGADRLASNSMTDGLVFGNNAVNDIKLSINVERISSSLITYKYNINLSETKEIRILKERLQNLMWQKVGIIRSIRNLTSALNDINKIWMSSSIIIKKGINVDILELRNLITLAKLITISAIRRKESRGTHFLKDFQTRNDREWIRHVVL